MDTNPIPSELDGCSIRLEARDIGKNIARGYMIEISRDLFGWTIVRWGWGRVGTVGQSRQRAFAGEAEARKLLRQLLARRRSAPRRIGVAYQHVSF